MLTAEARGPGADPGLRARAAHADAGPAPAAARAAGGRKLTGWLFVPDPYAPWVPTAVAAGRRLLAAEPLRRRPVESPPGQRPRRRRLSGARDGDLPWLADYRDRRFANDVRPYATSAARGGDATARGPRPAPSGGGERHQPADPRRPRRAPPLARRSRSRAAQRLRRGRDRPSPSTSGLASGSSTPAASTSASGPRGLPRPPWRRCPSDVKALFVGDAPRVAPLAERLGHRRTACASSALVPHAVALGLPAGRRRPPADHPAAARVDVEQGLRVPPLRDGRCSP